MISLTLVPAGVAALGLAVLDGRLGASLWLTLRTGLGMALWLALWLGGGAWLGRSGRLDGIAADPLHALAVNGALALAAALPAALALRLTARRAPLGALHGLAWFGGVILPQLGQAGAWPVASLALGLGCAIIAMALGALAGRG